MPEKYCLGIEATAHTFGAAVVSFSGRILSNEKAMYQTTVGGMIPNEVADHHRQHADAVIKSALDKASIRITDVSLISYSHGPGLVPSLRVGLEKARALAEQHGIPLVGVNHCVAHLTIGDLCCKTNDTIYLYVSGVNTQVLAVIAKRFRIFGETLDVGLGNALDKFGRELGLGFPAGPKIEQLAKNGKYIELPYSVKGMDVSFAGIVTKAARLVKEGKAKLEDVCFSLQETAFSMLAEISERALAHCEKQELLLIGGVAANQRLCEILRIMCDDRGAKFYAVPLQYSGDQGAMIAWQGVLQHKATGEKIQPEKADIYPYERTDEIEVVWR